MQIIKFYGDLNIFLSRKNKGKRTVCLPDSRRSIKDAVESLGIPHTEIGKVYLNKREVSPSCVLENGEVVKVYPFACKKAGDLSESSSEDYKFAADIHLGKLCRYLRLFGFDTFYSRELNDKETISLALEENRIILSRDIGLLKVSIVEQGYFVRNTEPRLQAKEVVTRYSLQTRIKPYSRCLDCNGEISQVKDEGVRGNLSAEIRRKYKEFYICRNCKKIYWKGYHSKGLDDIIKSITGN
ncbi:MAG: twitching motility protein PilT [Candidatus Omnitrophica bacterium]|nr:twitching motility protein PilT [Candidatus Omnitrophota bacterium]MBD3269506.1 twitching motility protein PilT [Candidatus Omnitrophota bacterium]